MKERQTIIKFASTNALGLQAEAITTKHHDFESLLWKTEITFSRRTMLLYLVYLRFTIGLRVYEEEDACRGAGAGADRGK